MNRVVRQTLTVGPLCVAVMLVSLFTSFAEATNRYVRTGATGSGTGADWTNAYTTLPATLVRGDIYYIAGGSYGSYTFDDATSGTTVTTVKKATQADHGTDTGWLSTYGTTQTAFSSIKFTTSYWTFDGVTGGGPGSWKTGFGFQINPTTSDAVSVLGVTGITIRHLAVIGPHVNGSGGATGTNAFTFRNGNGDFTLSYYYTDQLGLLPFFAVPIANVAGSKFLAEYGYIGGFYGDSASHSEVASIWNGIHGTVTFRYSIFGYQYSTGGLMWDNHEDHNARIDVYGNIFWRDPTLPGYDNCCNGVLGGWTGSNSEDCYNFHVYNNTFVNIPGAEVLSSFPDRTGNNEARNNLFYTVSDPGGSGVWQAITHNHFISTSSIGTNVSTSSGNPFVNLSGLDFRLTAGTPAGLPLAAPYNVDMFGNVRGADGTWDRGAIEFVGGGTLPSKPANFHITP